MNALEIRDRLTQQYTEIQAAYDRIVAAGGEPKRAYYQAARETGYEMGTVFGALEGRMAKVARAAAHRDRYNGE